VKTIIMSMVDRFLAHLKKLFKAPNFIASNEMRGW
jgi:hypothetical protein